MDAETQKEIRMQAIIKATGISMDEVNSKLRSNADRIESVGAKWDNLKVTLGMGLAPFFATLMDWITKAASGFDSLIQKMSGIAAIQGGDVRMAGYAQYQAKQSPAEQLKEAGVQLKYLADTKKAIEDVQKAKEKYVMTSKIQPDTKGYDEQLKQLNITLSTTEEHIKVLNNLQAYLPTDKKADGGLTPEALEKRQQKAAEAARKLQAVNDDIDSRSKIGLEKELSDLDKWYNKSYNDAKGSKATLLKLEDSYWKQHIEIVDKAQREINKLVIAANPNKHDIQIGDNGQITNYGIPRNDHEKCSPE